MKYSFEEIYLVLGQFDKVVTVSFRCGSDSHALYGTYITGEFIYTPVEREALQKLVGQADMPRNDGYVKFNELPRNLVEAKRDLLRQSGIRASDILEIWSLEGGRINDYANTKTRSLPKPIELKLNFDGIDPDILTINTYSQIARSGGKLIPDEWNQYHAAMLRKYGDQILNGKMRDLVLDPETGEIKSEVRLHYLESKYYSKQGLTGEEDTEFKSLLDQRAKERTTLAISEVKKSTENLKKIVKVNPNVISIVTYLCTYFREDRLTHGQFPVWWDFERFLHIFLRHVQETQVGERFADKTVFQYKINHVKKLVEIVLDIVNDDIEQHFLAYPDKDFRRHGAMSVYYNGDYYSFHISTDGRLMTFYKSSKNG